MRPVWSLDPRQAPYFDPSLQRGKSRNWEKVFRSLQQFDRVVLCLLTSAIKKLGLVHCTSVFYFILLVIIFTAFYKIPFYDILKTKGEKRKPDHSAARVREASEGTKGLSGNRALSPWKPGPIIRAFQAASLYDNKVAMFSGADPGAPLGAAATSDFSQGAPEASPAATQGLPSLCPGPRLSAFPEMPPGPLRTLSSPKAAECCLVLVLRKCGSLALGFAPSLLPCRPWSL